MGKQAETNEDISIEMEIAQTSCAKKLNQLITNGGRRRVTQKLKIAKRLV